MTKNLFISALPKNKQKLADKLSEDELSTLFEKYDTWMATLREEADIQVQCELMLTARARGDAAPHHLGLRPLIRVVDADEGHVLFEEFITVPVWDRVP